MNFFRTFLSMAVFFLFFCVLPDADAQIEDADLIFSELRNLEGTWFMPSDRGDRLEIWDFRDDSTLVGRNLRIKLGTTDTVLLENMRIEWRSNRITYFSKARGQNAGQEVAFTLTQAGYNFFVFENPQHDDPKKIRYLLLDRRELQVTTEGERNGRTSKTEHIYEREFNPASIQFRVRVGLNAHSLFALNKIGVEPLPMFSPRLGWELGVSTLFQGAGGMLNFHVEGNLTGKFSHVVADFQTTRPPDPSKPDSLPRYIRDATYHQTWLSVSFMPEILFRRNGKFSLVFGGYYAHLLINRLNGVEQPIRNTKVFNYNNDFKKNDLGAVVGFNFRKNMGRKDVDGIWSLRFHFGMSNIDNLYVRGPKLYNGRVGWAGASLSYGINLLKI